MAFESGKIPVIGISASDVVKDAVVPQINIALSQQLGSQVSLLSGLSLYSGDNYLRTQILPLVTGQLQSEINSQIGNSLGTAGDLAPVLSKAALSAIPVPQLTAALSASQGFTRAFPGAGDEPAANYGGYVYNLGPNGPDVIFSIVPANSGAQTAGQNSLFGQAGSIPPTVASNQLTNAAELRNAAVNAAKNQIMTEKGTPVSIPGDVA